jgi:putative transposase
VTSTFLDTVRTEWLFYRAMPRTARAAVGGMVYHVLNRGNDRRPLFRKPGDFDAFAKLLVEGLDRAAVELFAFCLMGNHWHLLLRPKGDGDLAAYLSWVTNTHVKRVRAHRPRSSGHLYQGRYKSFPVQGGSGRGQGGDGHFLEVARYIEADARRARLVRRAMDWKWSSLGCAPELAPGLLSEWPVDKPADWAALVEEIQPKGQLQRLQTSLERDRPLGDDAWVRRTAARLGLTHTINPRGRPRKRKQGQTPAKQASPTAKQRDQ